MVRPLSIPICKALCQLFCLLLPLHIPSDCLISPLYCIVPEDHVLLSWCLPAHPTALHAPAASPTTLLQLLLFILPLGCTQGQLWCPPCPMHASTSALFGRFLPVQIPVMFLKTPVWWVDPGWMPGAHQSRSITPPPQLDRGEKT